MLNEEPAHDARELRQDRQAGAGSYTPIRPPPPSGVAGLTPTQVRAQLARMGWTTALPIVGLDTKHTGAAKAPGIRGWQQRARFEGPETTAADLKAWERKERQWPGTGIACGNVVAIDADFATDAVLAEQVIALAFEVFGSTPFLRQGQAPKVAAIYRAAEAISSISLKAADGSGDGLDVLAENRQVVAYGTHRKALKSYAWIGPESPLTAGPDAAPEITQAQVDAFIVRLRDRVDLNGTGGRSGRSGGIGGGEIVRGADGRVVDGREFHLTRTVYRVARAMRAEGADLSVASLAARAWDAFAASTVLDDGRWSPEAARIKATALFDKARRGLVNLDPHPGASREPVEPTYPDRAVSVPEAEAAVAAIVSDFFGQHVPAWQASERAWAVAAAAAEGAGQPKPPKPLPTSWAARIETGIGKTSTGVPAVAAAAKAGLSVIYAVPRHQLGAEIVERFAKVGVEAQVYRGRGADDPEAPGSKMCLDPGALKDVLKAGLPVGSTICSKRVGGQTVRCPLYDQCGTQRQSKAKPTVWIVAHTSLFSRKPEAIAAPDALVIDETFAMGALPSGPARISLDDIERAPVEPTRTDDPKSEAANDLDLARASLMRALRDHKDDGPLQRDILKRHGITAGMAGAAAGFEWRRRRDPGFVPGMPSKAREVLVSAVAQHNATVKRLAGIWEELWAFLIADDDRSGRLALRCDPATGARFVEHLPLKQFRDSWRAPTLLLDATLPGRELLEPVLGHPVVVKADIAARWSPYVTITQITGAPVSKGKLGILAGQAEADGPRRVVRDLVRRIGVRAALAWPRTVAVVGPQGLIAKLKDIGLPRNAETGHFGALAGFDGWKDAAGLICIGQEQIGPLETEPMVGVFTGCEPTSLPLNEAGSVWYPRRAGGIRLADGTGVRVEHSYHPDPAVEAVRWQVTEAGLIQAIGRLRALRRGPDTPTFLEIISDVPLPITVNRVERWTDVRPGAWADMAGEGVILESAADIEASFPEAAPSRRDARDMAAATLAGTSIEKFIIDVPANVRRVTYKRLGRYAPTRAILFPNAPVDLRRWLGDRLGAIEWIRYEDGAEMAQARSAEDRDIRPPSGPPVRPPDIQAAEGWDAETRTDRMAPTPIWRSFARNAPPPAAVARTEYRSGRSQRSPASGQIWRPQADP